MSEEPTPESLPPGLPADYYRSLGVEPNDWGNEYPEDDDADSSEETDALENPEATADREMSLAGYILIFIVVIIGLIAMS